MAEELKPKEELKLQTHQRPTYFNKEMVIGALTGTLVPLIGTLVPAVLPFVFPVAVGVGAIGAAVGGYLGKKRLDKEYSEGKTVYAPSYINKDTAIGALLGNAVGQAIGLAALITMVDTLAGPGLFSMIGSGEAGIATKIMEPLVALGAGVASWAGSAAIGAYFGAKAGYRNMEREFKEAKEQQREKDCPPTVEKERSQTPQTGVQQEQSTDKSFTRAEADRMVLRAAQDILNTRQV